MEEDLIVSDEIKGSTEYLIIKDAIEMAEHNKYCYEDKKGFIPLGSPKPGYEGKYAEVSEQIEVWKSVLNIVIQSLTIENNRQQEGTRRDQVERDRRKAEEIENNPTKKTQQKKTEKMR